MSRQIKKHKKPKSGSVERIESDPHDNIEATSQVYSGPLPPASEMERYHDINPDFSNRIISMAEKEAESRRLLETASMEANIQLANKEVSERKRGQIFALSIGVSGLVCAGFLGWKGAEAAASIIGGATLLGMVTAFIAGANAAKQENGDS